MSCVQVTWTKLIRANPEHAWVAKVPTWPLTLVFLAQFAAVGGAICELSFFFHMPVSSLSPYDGQEGGEERLSVLVGQTVGLWMLFHRRS